MKAHLMKIKEKFLNAICSGQKKHEYRLNEPSRQRIQINDRITLISSSNSTKFINVFVKDKKVFSSWRDAISNFWQDDFKGIYKDVDNALRECYSFYDRELVDKYGIVVFSIEPEKIDLKGKMVLLDTNIVIERESVVDERDDIANKVMMSVKRLRDIGCKLFVCQKSKDEITKFKNERIRDSVLAKIDNSYNLLQGTSIPPDDFFDKTLEPFKKDQNGVVDNFLLLQLYQNVCDFLYTNDTGILEKAKRLYLADRVLTTDKILESLKANSAFYKEYENTFINLVSFKDVDLSDKFFDSLKEDYPGFEKWFNRKQNEKCYVYRKNGSLKGFLYFKEEGPDEDYSDFCKPFVEKKRRLKVGTFKIDSTGLRMGERFVQIIVEACAKRNIDEIYVTLFENKRAEVRHLKTLLEDWGFVSYTFKKNGELVLVKQIKSYQATRGIKQNYPLPRPNCNYCFLPILPNYHSMLFPDLRLKTENSASIEMACAFALEKIYITKFKSISGYEKGDAVLIYRMGEEGRSKIFSSRVTGICVLNYLRVCKDVEDLIRHAKNKSVFDENQIRDFASHGYLTIISLIYIKPLNNGVLLGDLYNENILEEGSGPRILQKLSKSDYEKILKKGGGVNENRN